MDLYECQGKALLASYGVEVGPQFVASTPAECSHAQMALQGPVVLKAQVLTGGRGKSGGVKVARSSAEAEQKAREIFDLTIKGFPVKKVLVVPAVTIEKEYYLGLTLDRSHKCLVLMMSASGGVDVEELAATHPEEIVRVYFSPASGVDADELSAALDRVFVIPALVEQARTLVHVLLQVYLEKDCSLIEINPYALVEGGRLMVLDSKISFDESAMFRQPDILAMRNPEENSDDERKARLAGLSYVSMDGDIGCIVNGAGLAMATMDIIGLCGGAPANFLDVGGSSNPHKVANALAILQHHPGVRAILINVFGGITRCDDIANGIVMAMNQTGIDVPLVVRLIGTNEALGMSILRDAGVAVRTDLDEAVRAVVAARETRA